MIKHLKLAKNRNKNESALQDAYQIVVTVCMIQYAIGGTAFSRSQQRNPPAEDGHNSLVGAWLRSVAEVGAFFGNTCWFHGV